MSLIIINKSTLKNIAIITIKNIESDLVTEKNGDLTVVKSDNEIVGINVFNYQKYFDAKEGAHTINEHQIRAISKMGTVIKDSESKFVVGKVIEREIHPKTNKLFVLKVKAHKELQIVTNSLNSTIGKKVIVAKVGATLPSGISIKHSQVMGIDSEGMLCGGETLGKEKTKGIFITDKEEGEVFTL